jgi:hypothetical protein
MHGMQIPTPSYGAPDASEAARRLTYYFFLGHLRESMNYKRSSRSNAKLRTEMIDGFLLKYLNMATRCVMVTLLGHADA